MQTIKDKIYQGKYSDLPYFIYISKLLEVKEFISYVNFLLKDPYLLEYYCVEDKLIENLVLYMFKWKCSKEPVFIKNKDYFEELVTILPEHSDCRVFVLSTIEFASMLSTPEFPIEYPLTEDGPISIVEISAIISNQSA